MRALASKSKLFSKQQLATILKKTHKFTRMSYIEFSRRTIWHVHITSPETGR